MFEWRHIKFLSFLWIFLAFARFAAAADLPPEFDKFGCVPIETVNRYINEFNIDVNTFQGGLGVLPAAPGAPASTSSCDNTKELKKLFSMLQLLELGQFQTGPNTTKAQLDRGFIQGSYYDFFLKRVRKIVRTFKQKNEILAYLEYFVGQGTGTMNINSVFSRDDISTLDALSTLVHEARHADSFPHLPCTQGPKIGETGGCDARFSDGGAYAVENEYLARIALNGTNFHPLFKAMARVSAVEKGFNNFNEVLFKERDALAMIGKSSGGIVFFDQKETFVIRTQVKAPKSHLVALSSGITLGVVPEDRTQNAWGVDLLSPYFIPEIATSIENKDNGLFSATLINYNTKWDRDVRSAFVDYFEAEENRHDVLGLLLDSQVQYITEKSRNTIDFQEDNFTPLRLLTVSPQGRPGLYILSKEGSILDVSSIKTAKKQEDLVTKLIPKAVPAGMQTVVPYSGQVLGLNAEGTVVSLTPDGKQTPFAPLQPYQFADLVRVSYYNGFDVVRGEKDLPRLR